MRNILISILFLLALILSSCNSDNKVTILKSSSSELSNSYVGVKKCAECHSEEYNRWDGSHHYYAMQEANDSSITADFEDFEFKSSNINTRFFKDTDNYKVYTEGKGGAYKTYTIKYVFGYSPLQQFLVELDSGKIQALRYAWDTEKKRWIDLYKEEEIIPQDWLHWTKGGLNWNTMCAECHTTDFNKGYNQETDSYNSTFSAINVSCESCHGPGENHIKWAEDPREGLKDILLTSTSTSDELIRSCAPCHARKGNIVSKLTFDGEFLNDFIPELLSDNLYHADGQIDDEVYVYGSFLQSAMYQNGVNCSDCHDVHSLELKYEGNKLCMQCHETTYNESSHSFHEKDISCVDCHMTGKTYMQVDFRRDHSFRIPRPDQSVIAGTPNACTQCHTDKEDQWAAKIVREWYGERRKPHFSDALIIGRQRTPESVPKLTALLLDNTEPEIARATAALYLGDVLIRPALEALVTAISDSSAMVRNQALRSLYSIPPIELISAIGPMLNDSVRAVRISAAEILNSINEENLPLIYQASFNSADYELRKSLENRSDFPMGQFSLGQYYFQKGDNNSSKLYFKRAIRMDTLLHPARENLARLYNMEGNNVEAVKQLRTTISLDPGNYQAMYSLGLVYSELSIDDSSLYYLNSVIEIEPQFERAYYNIGVMHQISEKIQESEKTFLLGIKNIPETLLLRRALAILYVQNQQLVKARPVVDYLIQYLPEDPEINQLNQIINQ